MIEKLAKALDTQARVDPVARLAMIAVPVLVGLIGTLLLIMLGDIKDDITGNQDGLDGLKDIVATMQQGFAVQQQIIDTMGNVAADQEGRLRLLENWQRVLNSQPNGGPQ